MRLANQGTYNIIKYVALELSLKLKQYTFLCLSVNKRQNDSIESSPKY